MQNSKGTDLRVDTEQGRSKELGYSYVQMLTAGSFSTKCVHAIADEIRKSAVIIGVIEPKRAPHCRELNDKKYLSVSVCAHVRSGTVLTKMDHFNCARSVARAEHAAFANQPHPLQGVE